MRGKLTINAATIKIIAMITMVLDHIGYILYGHIPGEVYTILRAVGRISFPLFTFCIAEGFFYTGDVKKYIIRVLIFAFISEIPYNFFAYGSIVSLKSCNVLFTFVIALLVLWFCRYCDSMGKRGIPFSVLGVIAGMAFAYLIKSDYSYRGVALVVALYYTRFNEYARCVVSGIILWINGEVTDILSPLAFVPIHFYNGEKGRMNKWVCYFFYPVQLLIIGIVGRYIYG